MRENRTCGSEGGEAQSLPYPYRYQRADANAPMPALRLSGSADFLVGIVDARRASTQPQQPPTSISTSKPSATAPELS